MAGRKNKRLTFGPENIAHKSGLNDDGTPNIYWQKFEERIAMYKDLSPTEWTDEQILGYLLHRYVEHFGIGFTLSYSGAPGKCSEMYCVRRMLTTVGTKKGHIAKEYIDWVFDENIIKRKVRVTSLAFFFTPKLCSEFKTIYRSKNTITKTTPLPPDFIEAAQKLDLSVNTYGDLAFAKMALDYDPTREDLANYNSLFAHLKETGFDDNILTTLHD